MSRTTEIIEYTVEVTPARGDSMADMKQNAEDMVCDIRRHIDYVSCVRIMTQSEQTCEHCGCTWTEISADYNGGCCHADESSNPNPPKDATHAEQSAGRGT